LKTAQVTAQKQQEAELESLRTQLIFKQHEIEASRRAVPRVSAPSQPAGLSQTQRSDVPRTPHSLHVAIPDCQSPRPVAPPPRLSKARPPPPGFVNAFALPLQKKNKGKARASVLEESRRTHEQDLDLPPLSPIGAPAKALAYSQPDEGMEIDGGQAGGTTYPEVDFHMDLANDVKMPQPVAEVLRASKSFDWVNWVRLQLPLSHALGLHILAIDEKIGTRSCNVATCSQYNSTSACSAAAWCKSHECLPRGMHIPYRCGSWLCRVRARCADCRKFVSTDREYIAA
jgi:hypothetical protein